MVQQQLPTARAGGRGGGAEPALSVAGLVRDNTQPSPPLPPPEHRYAVPHLRLPLTWCPLTALPHKLVPVHG